MYFFKTFLRPPLKCMESQASEPFATQYDDVLLPQDAGKLSMKEPATAMSMKPTLFGVIRGSSSESSRSEPEIEAEPGAEMSLDECVEIVADARPWTDKRFENVRLLQNAARNQGKVELQKDLLQNGKFVAVKRMPVTWTGKNHKDFLEKHPSETELPWMDLGLAKYLHAKGFRFICEPFGTFRSERETFFVSEFADRGDLFEWCQAGPTPGEEREQMLRPVAQQIFAAVGHLHSLKIAHCDLSLENILLATTSPDDPPQVKLIDFGMAVMNQDFMVGPRGKPSYQAPEMHEQCRYDPCLADAFSVGVVLFGMVAQDYPWLTTKPNGCKCFEFARQKGLQAYMMKRKARNSGGARLSEVFSDSLMELLEALLKVDPAERSRIGASTLPWLGEEL